jgi:hypothetical protein
MSPNSLGKFAGQEDERKTRSTAFSDDIRLSTTACYKASSCYFHLLICHLGLISSEPLYGDNQMPIIFLKSCISRIGSLSLAAIHHGTAGECAGKSQSLIDKGSAKHLATLSFHCISIHANSRRRPIRTLHRMFAHSSAILHILNTPRMSTSDFAPRVGGLETLATTLEVAVSHATHDDEEMLEEKKHHRVTVSNLSLQSLPLPRSGSATSRLRHLSRAPEKEQGQTPKKVGSWRRRRARSSQKLIG